MRVKFNHIKEFTDAKSKKLPSKDDVSKQRGWEWGRLIVLQIVGDEYLTGPVVLILALKIN